MPRMDGKPSNWQQIIERVRNRDNERCRNCGSESDLEVHHVVPVRRGGSHSISNLITLCHDCHVAADKPARDRTPKKLSDPKEDPAWIEENTFFSEQESKVIVLEKDGLTQSEIADEIGTSRSSVNSASQRINRKGRFCMRTLQVVDRDFA